MVAIFRNKTRCRTQTLGLISRALCGITVKRLGSLHEQLRTLTAMLEQSTADEVNPLSPPRPQQPRRIRACELQPTTKYPLARLTIISQIRLPARTNACKLWVHAQHDGTPKNGQTCEAYFHREKGMRRSKMRHGTKRPRGSGRVYEGLGYLHFCTAELVLHTYHQ
jgi:hypothetical protein